MTTKEITPLTHQQVFDNALNGVRAQGYMRSTLRGSCSYRGMGTLKCGIGHSIPDEMYESAMDTSEHSTAINDVICSFSNLASLFKGCHSELLKRLQEAHDSMIEPFHDSMIEPFQFENAMWAVADDFDLKYTKP